MPVIHERMPAGIPGCVSRMAGAVIEAAQVADTAIPVGSPVQLDASGKLTGPVDENKPVYGFVVRQFPVQAHSEAENGPGPVTVKPGSVANVLRAGYLSVKLSAAEGAKPVKGEAVKALFADAGSFKQGELAVSQGTAIERCTFMGEADPSGNTEIAFNI